MQLFIYLCLFGLIALQISPISRKGKCVFRFHRNILKARSTQIIPFIGLTVCLIIFILANATTSSLFFLILLYDICFIVEYIMDGEGIYENAFIIRGVYIDKSKIHYTAIKNDNNETLLLITLKKQNVLSFRLPIEYYDTFGNYVDKKF